NRAVQAAERAIANPLLDGVSMKGAKGVIISITGGDDMRLMEVDEAASTIKELVDPDANIIWGSAFNNELDGVIRVSVVATGIEAEAMEAPEPARVFAFPNAKKEAIIKPAKATVADMVSVEAAPGTPAPMTEETPAASAAPVMTSAEVTASPSMHTDEAPVIATASVLPPAADELVLGAEDMLELSEEVQATEPAAEASKTHSWLAPGKDEAIAPLPEAKPAEPAPRIAHGGGTLFERMSNIAKGNARGTEDAETKSDPLDIPRFLNRQNNQ
ncbi:MAG: cell division protein FtsZ, partial [Alphaproteobacteria bacterium]|nr:cell division protein FtsZ [Alphaproteobacteria bacterium]